MDTHANVQTHTPPPACNEKFFHKPCNKNTQNVDLLQSNFL